METKICSSCKLEKNKEEFNKRSSSKDGLGSYCKLCNKDKLKQHYHNNKEYYYSKSKNHSKKIQDWFNEFRKTLSCIKCNESRWWVLDFHHRNPQDKDGNISSMIMKNSKEKILQEIDKCDILCSNCHRDIHYQEKIFS